VPVYPDNKPNPLADCILWCLGLVIELEGLHPEGKFSMRAFQALLLIWGFKPLQALSVLSKIPSMGVPFSVPWFADGIHLCICCILGCLSGEIYIWFLLACTSLLHPSYLTGWLYMYGPHVGQALNGCSVCLCSKLCPPFLQFLSSEPVVSKELISPASMC